jgi:hypothetical protein
MDLSQKTISRYCPFKFELITLQCSKRTEYVIPNEKSGNLSRETLQLLLSHFQ